MSSLEGKKIFISYAHKDKAFVDIFLEFFKSVKPKDCEIWQDIDGIKVGTDWYESIVNTVNSVDIAILLVSNSFLASDFIKVEELKRFVQLSKEKKCLAFPIYFKPCKIDKAIELKKYQFFKPNGEKYGSNGEFFCFSDLVKFNTDNGAFVPNIKIDHYINDCFEALESAYQFHIKSLPNNPTIPEEPNKDEFMFVNRDQELKELLSETCPDFLIIKAPLHYGKTYLIEELRKRLEKKWKDENMKAEFTYFNFNDTTIKNVENKIKKLEADLFNKGSYNYLAFDNIDKLGNSDFEQCITIIESIVSRFLQAEGVKLKIILSNKSSIEKRLGEKSKRKFEPFGELSPFNIKVIKLAIEKKCNNLKETLLNQLAKDIYNYSGGHPGIIVKIIKDIAETNSFLFAIDQPQYYFRNRGQDFVKKAIDYEIDKLTINTKLNGELKYFFIARGLEFGMIKKIVSHPSTKSLFKLFPNDIKDELLKTNFFETKGARFYSHHDHIIRLLFKSYLYNNDIQSFKKTNEIILEYFEEYFKREGRDTVEFSNAMNEYFYHLLLAGLYNSKSKKGIWNKLNDKIMLRKDDQVLCKETILSNIDAEIHFLCSELYANETPPELDKLLE